MWNKTKFNDRTDARHEKAKVRVGGTPSRDL